MGPLISIRCVPFQYEMVINDAKLEMQSPRPQQQVDRTSGGMQISHTTSAIRIDTTAARESLGLKSTLKASEESGQKGMSAASQATGQMASEGNRMMDTRNKDVFGDIGYQRSKNSIETMMGFLPSVKADVSFTPHQLNMKYEMDKLQFDWRVSGKAEMSFTPASIEFKVKGYAKVEIEYTGGPIYAPPSADPNYTPPPGMDVRG